MARAWIFGLSISYFQYVSIVSSWLWDHCTQLGITDGSHLDESKLSNQLWGLIIWVWKYESKLSKQLGGWIIRVWKCESKLSNQLEGWMIKVKPYHADEAGDNPDNNSKSRRSSKEQHPLGTDKDPAAHDDPNNDPNPVEQSQLSLQLGPTILIVVVAKHLRGLLQLHLNFLFFSLSHLEHNKQEHGKFSLHTVLFTEILLLSFSDEFLLLFSIVSALLLYF